MYTKEEFLNNMDLTLCLGDDVAEKYNLTEDKDILKAAWSTYKPADWAKYGFYKVRGIVYDLENDMYEFQKEVSTQTFKKACKLSGRDWRDYL